MQLQLKEVKVVKGLNRAAKSFGCSKGHLSLVIRGLRKPGTALARKISKAGITIERDAV